MAWSKIGVVEAATMIIRPTSVLPVKEAYVDMSICSAMRFPTVWPYPEMTSPLPLTRDAMSRIMRHVISDGLRTIQFPVARAGAIFQIGLED